MSNDQMKMKRFAKENALIVAHVLMVGSTEHGEHVGLEIETEDKRNCALLFPFSLFQRLMLSLMTAGGIAHRDQVARFGSSSMALAAGGFSAFKPSGYDVARLRLVDGEDVVLLRLKQGALPIIDVRLSPGIAKQMVHDLGLEAAKAPIGPAPRN